MSLLCVCVHIFMHCNSCMFVCLCVCLFVNFSAFLLFDLLKYYFIVFNHCVKNCMFVC